MKYFKVNDGTVLESDTIHGLIDEIINYAYETYEKQVKNGGERLSDIDDWLCEFNIISELAEDDKYNDIIEYDLLDNITSGEFVNLTKDK